MGMTVFFISLCEMFGAGIPVLDSFVKHSMLCGFLDSFTAKLNEKTAWEFWLYKDTGKSWNDFKLSVIPQELTADTKEIEIIERSLMKGGIFK